MVKQKNPLLTDVTITMLDNLYQPSVTVDQGPVTLVHNLKENLGGGTITGNPSRWTGIGEYHSCADILHKENVNMLYDVTVSVYQNGQYEEGFTGEPMVTLNGTMND